MTTPTAVPVAGRTAVVPPFPERWLCVSYWKATGTKEGWEDVDICESEAKARELGERHLKSGLTGGYRVFRLPGDATPVPSAPEPDYRNLRRGTAGCTFHPSECRCGHCVPASEDGGAQ